MSDDIPAPILDAVRRAILQHPDDLNAMVECAIREAKETTEYKGYRESLAARAIRGLVYDERHRANVSIRRAAGGYGGPAKVNRAESLSVQSVYAYSIAGRSLGQLYGRDLPNIIESEASIADGHLFNVRLCKRLKELVGDEQQVQEAVKESRLRRIFKECEKGK
jgi:hypothetical protein